MNKNFRKLVLPVSLLIASQSYGLGLGGLQVNSALDEVLDGEIPFIIDNSESIENIKVSVASSAEYKRVGLDKTYVPANIDVSIVDEDGVKNIQITSRGPVSEPIVSLLLVVDWANGHLLREYTLLLDPPVFSNTEQNYSEPVQTETYQAPTKIESIPQEIEETTQVTQSTIANDAYRGSNEVVVESGDTLWKIASKFSDGYSSPQQTMVAIFNNNPDAFQNNDMNFLKRGAKLTIPDSDQISMISNGQAIAEVKSATQNWSRQQTLAGDSDVGITDTTNDYGIELIPPNDSDLSDTSNSSGTSNNSQNRQTLADLNRAKEELASLNLENEDLSSRVRELEQIVEDQKNALSLKDNDLAQIQSQLSDSETMVDADSSEEIMNDDVWGDTANQNEDETADSSDSSDGQLGDSTEIADVNGSDESTDMERIDLMADDAMDDSIVEDSMNDDTLVITDTNSDVQSSDESEAAAIQELNPPRKEQSFMDKILSYKYEGLIGLGVILLGILGFVFFKRRGEDEGASDSGFLDSISNDDKPSLDGSATELDLSNLNSIDELDELSSEADEGQEEVESLDDLEHLYVETAEEVIDDLETIDSNDLDLDLDLDASASTVEQDLDLSDFDDLDLDLDESEGGLKEVLDDLNVSESSDGLESDSGSNDSELEGSLDLDFDLDDLEIDEDLSVGENSEVSNESSDAESAENLLEEDFDFDLGLDMDLDTDADSLEDVAKDTDELEDLAFDTGERTIVEEVESADEDLEFDLDDDLFNTDELELTLDDSGTTEISNDDDITELDLTSLDSDELSIDSEGDVDIGLDFDDLGGDDAIDTKLDLAKAYFEMGDIDGAKQMVVEIIEEGTDEQKTKAESLRSEIEGS